MLTFTARGVPIAAFSGLRVRKEEPTGSAERIAGGKNFGMDFGMGFQWE